MLGGFIHGEAPREIGSCRGLKGRPGISGKMSAIEAWLTEAPEFGLGAGSPCRSRKLCSPIRLARATVVAPVGCVKYKTSISCVATVDTAIRAFAAPEREKARKILWKMSNRRTERGFAECYGTENPASFDGTAYGVWVQGDPGCE